MKKSYIKIIILLLIFSILFILNIFTFKILDQIKLDIILLLIFVLTYITLGFEKDRHRYTKDVILEITIILISFLGLFSSAATRSLYNNRQCNSFFYT